MLPPPSLLGRNLTDSPHSATPAPARSACSIWRSVKGCLDAGGSNCRNGYYYSESRSECCLLLAVALQWFRFPMHIHSQGLHCSM